MTTKTNPIMTAKTLSEYFDVSERTARTYLKDIRKAFDIKIVTESHVIKYFKI